jgi:flagellar basal-body rod protein FlgC
MNGAFSIAASGLNAASLRLSVSASNIANAESAGPLPSATGQAAVFPPAYTPQRVDQVDIAGASGSGGAGTAATVTAVDPATVAAYDPTAPYADPKGFVAAPKVDLTGEAMNLLIAKYGYAANAEVMRVLAQTIQYLLDFKV